MILNLPDVVLEKIFSYLKYEQVSRCRLVCPHINYICQKVLNEGFYKAERFHLQCLKRVKAQLPRRESERKKHPLSRHCEILAALETRLSLLGMTYLKCMDMDLCCFIPGKVLDELFSVLRYVFFVKYSVDGHEVLQELRDLSSMAMEHFEEKVGPLLRKQKAARPTVANIPRHECRPARQFGPAPHLKAIPVDPKSTTSSKKKKAHKFKEAVKQFKINRRIANNAIQSLNQTVADIKNNHEELTKKIVELEALITSQVEKTNEQDLKIEYLNRDLVSNSSTKPSERNDGKILPSANIEADEPLDLQRKKRQTESTLSETSCKRQKTE